MTAAEEMNGKKQKHPDTDPCDLYLGDALLDGLKMERISIFSETGNNIAYKIKYSEFGIFLDFLHKIFYNQNQKGGRTHGHS